MGCHLMIITAMVLLVGVVACRTSRNTLSIFLIFRMTLRKGSALIIAEMLQLRAMSQTLAVPYSRILRINQ